MRIRYLAHASFFVTSASGVRIVFDPYEPGALSGALGYGRLTDPADIVLITHEHHDHNFAAGVPGNPQVIKGAGVHDLAGIRFRGVGLKHDAAGGSQRGDNTVFCAEIDGVRLCHLGDLGHELTSDQVAQVGAVDVLMCPVGGTYTIDAAGATRTVAALKPAITIPMHFKTDRAGLNLAPVDDFLRGKDDVRLQGGSELEVTADSLPGQPQIVVLEPAL